MVCFANMDGLITAIVSFIFICILFPRLVKNSAQFYIGVAAIVVLILFQSLAAMFGSVGFHRFVGGLNGLLLLVSFVTLILATGGLSLKDFTGEFKNAFEVIRRGEEEKEIIVPLTGEQPRPRRQSAASDDVPPPPVNLTPTASRPSQDQGSIPLE